MTIQSQLDQVLAPCPFCGTSGPRHCTTKDEYGRPSYGVQCVGGECAIVGPQAGSQVAAAEKWNRQHGPAIRAAVGGVGETVAWWREDHVCHAHELTAANALADGYKPCVIKCEDCAWNASLCDTHGAVGGEAVAWRMLRANGKPYTGWKDLPVPEWASINVDDGMRLEYAYASPPATVDVGANDFLDGMIAALGCLWLGFGYGPGTAEYDEVLNSAGRAKVLERAKKMHPEDIANSAYHHGRNSFHFNTGDQADKFLADLAPPSGEGFGPASGKNISDVMSRYAPTVSMASGKSLPEYAYSREQVLAMLWDLEGKYATPQSAPVDEKLVLVPRYPSNKMQVMGLTALDESDATPPDIGHLIGYKAIRELWTAMLAAAPTPPPASQERGGYVHRCTVHPEWMPECPVCADGLPVKTIAASPPSSAAEPKAERVIVDYNYNGDPVFADAAEQAKPVAELVKDGPPYSEKEFSRIIDAQAEQAKPDRSELIRETNYRLWMDGNGGCEPPPEWLSEQAQAGELQFVREALSRLAEKVAYLDGSEVTITKADACAIGQELLRRLAGGVTVDDAMVRRALDGQDAYWNDDTLYVTCERCDGKGHHGGFGEGGHDQDWCETCGGPGSINIGTESGGMRAALVAALGAK